MSYRVIRPANREEWLEERKKGIGSSDAGTIMGASSFNTPLGLWQQKTGREPATPENEAMFNGHILEPAVAAWFAAKTGAIIDKTSEGDWIAADTEKDYLRVSPDRLFWEKDTPQEKRVMENALILEIKSTTKYVSDDDFPDYWYCQVQYQMGVMGVKRCCIAWITSAPKLQFGYTQVEFNQAFYNTLISAIDHFWNVNIKQDTPPEAVSGKDTLALFPKANADSCNIASDSIVADWKRLKEVRKEIKELEEQEDDLIDRMKMATGEAERLVKVDTDTGEMTNIATWKNQSTSYFDEETFGKENNQLYLDYIVAEDPKLDKDRLKKEHPEVYNKYLKKTQGTRKFIIK